MLAKIGQVWNPEYEHARLHPISSNWFLKNGFKIRDISELPRSLQEGETSGLS